MKWKFEILMVIAVLCLPEAMFGEADPFFSRIDYSVSLPMADDDIVYSLRLSSVDNPSDTILDKRYLIQWEISSRDDAKGFSAYFDGHFYNYRDNRLREYHYEWDSIPFQTTTGGVQRNPLFFNLFPFEIERQLNEMRADSTFTLTRTESGDAITIHGLRTIDGTEAQEFDLVCDRQGRPLKLTRLFNPGMIGEQLVTAVYTYDSDPEADAEGENGSQLTPSSEEELIALFPEVFEHYRTSNFSIENMRGRPLPSFALPTVAQEHYVYDKGTRLTTPKLVALLDPAVASTGSTIAAMRRAAAMLPRQAGLIFAFVDNDVDRVEELVGPSMIGETTLISARSLARDTGANSFPTILLVNSDGTVADVILGYSADLRDQLLQKGALLK